METWKFINDFEGLYEVSDLGRVRNQKGHVLKPTSNNRGKGYLFVMLYRNGRQYNKKIHRLVAAAFIPNPDNKPTVNHNNGNTKDNTASNLSWMTMQEQSDHAIREGLLPVGDRSYHARLSVEDIKTIIELRNLGKRQKEIAAQFEIARTTVSAICAGRIWKSITKGKANYSRVSVKGQLFTYEKNPLS